MSQLPKPMMPNQQSPTRQMNFHSKQTRNYHGSMPNTFPMSRPLLHTPISTGSIPHPLHQVSQSSRTMHAAVSPILTQQPFHKAEQFLYHQMTPPQASNILFATTPPYSHMEFSHSTNTLASHNISQKQYFCFNVGSVIVCCRHIAYNNKEQKSITHLIIQIMSMFF